MFLQGDPCRGVDGGHISSCPRTHLQQTCSMKLRVGEWVQYQRQQPVLQHELGRLLITTKIPQGAASLNALLFFVGASGIIVRSKDKMNAGSTPAEAESMVAIV